LSYRQGPASDPTNTPEVHAMTGGVAAGNFDGDGWVDLFVTRSDNTDILFRNLGNGQFDDVSTTAFGANPINALTNGAAWGDFEPCPIQLEFYFGASGMVQRHSDRENWRRSSQPSVVPLERAI